LNDIAGLQFEEVYILAHSMGSRLVTRVLAERQKSGSDIGRITELLLAAPDINADIFREQIAPVLGRLTNVRKTIYASSNDVALKVSMVLHGFPRVGETVSGVHIFEGFDTIDSSKAAPLARGFGHSYVFESRPVIADLEELLINRKPPSERRLKRMGVGNDQYWLIE
jgi:esterase/lipase superfamily enzyme